MRWKDFLYYQKGEKLAVIILLMLILLVLIFNILMSQRNNRQIVLSYNDSLVRSFEEFQRSIKERENYVEDDKESETTTNQYKSTQVVSKPKNHKNDFTEKYVSYSKTEKLSEGETISLNETDTSEWKKIPGIGSAFASRIVKYRNSLGGFASTEQLREVYGVDNEMYNRVISFISDDGNFRKIQVNKLEFKELLNHPYLNYKQVQAIFNLRKKRGKITSLNELAILDEFTADDITKLEPYLDFQ